MHTLSDAARAARRASIAGAAHRNSAAVMLAEGRKADAQCWACKVRWEIDTQALIDQGRGTWDVTNSAVPCPACGVAWPWVKVRA